MQTLRPQQPGEDTDVTFPEHRLGASLVRHTVPTTTLLGAFPAEGGHTETPGSRRAWEVVEAAVTRRVLTQPSGL